MPKLAKNPVARWVSVHDNLLTNQRSYRWWIGRGGIRPCDLALVVPSGAFWMHANLVRAVGILAVFHERCWTRDAARAAGVPALFFDTIAVAPVDAAGVATGPPCVSSIELLRYVAASLGLQLAVVGDDAAREYARHCLHILVPGV